jgi:hypothetical protein
MDTQQIGVLAVVTLFALSGFTGLVSMIAATHSRTPGWVSAYWVGAGMAITASMGLAVLAYCAA